MATPSGWTAEEAAQARGESAGGDEELQQQPDVAAEPADDGDDESSHVAAEGGDEESAPDPVASLRKAEAAAKKARDAERNRRKEAEREAREANHKLSLVNERLQTMWEMQQRLAHQPQQPQQPQRPPPNLDDDPAAFVKQLAVNQQVLSQNQQALAQRLQAEEQQRQMRAQAEATKQRLDHIFAQDLERTAEEIPDAREAAAYVYHQRLHELAMQGYSEPQAKNIIERDYYAAVHEWTQAGRSPAESFYNLARLRGYVPQQAGQQGDPETLRRVQRGQDAARSLSNVSGSSTKPGKMTAEMLASMSQRDFEAWMAKAGDDGFRDIMTGRR